MLLQFAYAKASKAPTYSTHKFLHCNVYL